MGGGVQCGATKGGLGEFLQQSKASWGIIFLKHSFDRTGHNITIRHDHSCQVQGDTHGRVCGGRR